MADSFRVLYVDDLEATEQAATRLREADDRLTVDGATSAHEGLERLDGDVDCIVSDYDLPETDGIDFLESVRERRPNLPFILFTDAGSEAVASEAISAGVTDYLRKDGGDNLPELVAHIVDAVETFRADEQEPGRELEAQQAKVRALHTVATRISTCDSSDAVYEAVVEAAEAILDFDIAIADAAVEDVLVPRAVSTELSVDEYFEETPIDAENNLGAEAYRTGKASVIDDLRDLDVVPADSEFRSALTVTIGDYGVFQSVDTDPGAFDEQDLEMAELLAEHARARLSQLEARQELQQRTEELQRKNERLDEFTRFVSHDLQSPLTVAQGRLELAQEDCDSEHLDDVAAAHQRMRNLIEDLLTLAREEKSATEYESVALAELVYRCWRTVETKEATLDVDVDATIQADHDRLRQLLENLLRNSVDHGGDDVTITVGELDDGFYLADDGEGIPEAERARVFESGYSTAADGTGFGLSIVKKITEAHGWDIDVTESEAGGARFEITGVEVDR
ncbi:response regulator [Natronomonas halophila]|uniref:ATP-binding response regulator n=1 Tax=Natronomonas halophila TaxID=2747817 RepID=UPI0015B64496|nr:ATP-binding protein [Natronomonas halophila]QLD86878.1 response regulator [Natronomonas halophila]